jgi:hypothetical protein
MNEHVFHPLIYEVLQDSNGKGPNPVTVNGPNHFDGTI